MWIVNRVGRQRLSEADGRCGVPIVQVEDIGSDPSLTGGLAECGDGGGERKEALGVVRPALTGDGIDVGMGASHAGTIDEDQIVETGS